jgi:hypothetical protein
MRKKVKSNLLAAVLIISACLKLCAQDIDTIKNKSSSRAKEQERISLLIYTRTIADAKGNLRFDQNIVSRIKLNDWLRLELGVRKGETSQTLDAYYHYKAELQTKSFWNTVRFVARLSDNIVKYTNPVYDRSNYLLIAEGKYALSGSWVGLLSGGYVFTRQQNNSLDGCPVTHGTQKNNPTYKIGLRYLIRGRGTIDAVWGTYDIFNPYVLSNPFFQLALEYEFSKRLSLLFNLRYQYNGRVDVPLNKFLGLGVHYHFRKS